MLNFTRLYKGKSRQLLEFDESLRLAVKKFRIGVVGLGRMGGNMARCLLDAGVDVVGSDVDSSKLQKFEDAGGRTAESPVAVANRVDIVITSLPTPDIVRDVYLDPDYGICATENEELLVLEMSTVDADTIVEIADALDIAKVNFLGAPVSGGPHNCRDGSLTVMVGGVEEIYESEPARFALDLLANEHFRVGGVDAGHTLKLVNNIMSLGNVLIAIEACTLGITRGIDEEVMFDILTESGGTSWAFERVFPRILARNFEPEFMLDYGKKDLRLALETAQGMDHPMLASSLIYNMFASASKAGYGQEDIGSVAKLFAEFQSK